MALKAGHVDDFSGSLAEAIENAMKAEWQTVKGEPMPDTDPKDRRILFVAIAQGVLGYLNAHANDAINTIEFDTGAGTTDTLSIESVDFNVSL
jgi:hypothetical protein